MYCVGYMCIWGSEDKSGYRSSDAFHFLFEAGPLTSLQLPCSYRLVGSCYSRDSLVSTPHPAISGIYKQMPPCPPLWCAPETKLRSSFLWSQNIDDWAISPALKCVFLGSRVGLIHQFSLDFRELREMGAVIQGAGFLPFCKKKQIQGSPALSKSGGCLSQESSVFLWAVGRPCWLAFFNVQSHMGPLPKTKDWVIFRAPFRRQDFLALELGVFHCVWLPSISTVSWMQIHVSLAGAMPLLDLENSEAARGWCEGNLLPGKGEERHGPMSYVPATMLSSQFSRDCTNSICWLSLSNWAVSRRGRPWWGESHSLLPT